MDDSSSAPSDTAPIPHARMAMPAITQASAAPPHGSNLFEVHF
jgi:hypothetical protein